MTPEEKRIYNRAYREANRERLIASMREYRLANLDTMRKKNREYMAKYRAKGKGSSQEYLRQYYIANKSHLSEVGKRYYETHKEEYNSYSRARRARVRSVPGRHTKAQILELFERQKHRCATCKAKISKKSGDPKKYHVDHVVPIIKGGSNGMENIQLLCEPCNLRKNKRDAEDWAKENGLLFC
jgi:5-methylcytosine-specific restriction endonuclease McrA